MVAAGRDERRCLVVLKAAASVHSILTSWLDALQMQSLSPSGDR